MSVRRKKLWARITAPRAKSENMQSLFFNILDTVIVGATRYAGFSAHATGSGNLTNADPTLHANTQPEQCTVVAKAGKMQNLTILIPDNIGASGTMTWTVVLNGVATALSVTYTPSGTNYELVLTDNITKVPVVQGDRIALKMTNNIAAFSNTAICGSLLIY